MKQREITAIDVDGTLTDSVCFTAEEIRKSVPKKDAVQKVNKMFDEGYVIIYTARRDNLISPTIEWLRKHGFRFHAISNNKMPFDHYYDDDAHTLS